MDQSPLSILPPELRNRIYDLTLVENDNITTNVTPMYDTPSRLWKPPPILQSCRQLRAEALPVYYGSNTFVVEQNSWLEPHILESFLGTIGLEARRESETYFPSAWSLDICLLRSMWPDSRSNG